MKKRNEQGQTSTQSLIVLVLIVIAIGLIAVATEINRSNYQAAAGSATATTTASTTASTTAPADSAAGAVSAVSRAPARAPSKNGSATGQSDITVITPPPASEPPPSSAPASSPAPSTASASPHYRLCTANDLTGTASWQGAGGSLAGTIVVTDSSRSGCSLSHDDYLQILSGGEVLPVGQLANTDAGAYSDLSPGDSASLPFLWSNWCGGALSYPAYVRLILPSNGGYLRVPLIDSGGNPQSDAPRCDSPQTYSSLRIWRY